MMMSDFYTQVTEKRFQALYKQVTRGVVNALVEGTWGPGQFIDLPA